MEKYKIRDKRILIYGAGSIGKVVSGIFHKAGIDIDSYVDQRAGIIKENDNKRVLHMDEVKEKIQEKDDYVIIITIRNVFEHSSLAKQFYREGFKNIIYKPITILRGNSNDIQNSINDAYEQITAKFVIPKGEIACYEKEEMGICDFGLYEESEDEVLVKMPAELLFSNTNPKAFIWSCQNFYSNYIAVDLYEAFCNASNGSVEEVLKRYIERFALPGAKVMGVNTDGTWKELLIDSRQKVYYEMEYKLWMDYSFFIQNCVKVGCRKGKGFELVSSGKNRVSFLIAKGFRYIPVKMKKSDYQSYLNMEVVEKVIFYLNQINDKIFAPIPHPYFYKIPVAAPDYAAECVKPIARFLSEQIYLENKKFNFDRHQLAICINDEGYMSRYFSMLGYDVARVVTDNQKLCELIDNIFYFKPSEFNRLDKNHYCSIVSDEMQKSIVEEYINNTDRFLILISSARVIEKMHLDYNPNFRFKRKIFEAVWNGRTIQGNVYEKDK